MRPRCRCRGRAPPPRCRSASMALRARHFSVHRGARYAQAVCRQARRRRGAGQDADPDDAPAPTIRTARLAAWWRSGSIRNVSPMPTMARNWAAMACSRFWAKTASSGPCGRAMRRPRGRKVDYAAILALVQRSETGGVAVAGINDDVPRFAAWRSLAPYGVVAIVGAAEEEVLAEHREQWDHYLNYAVATSLVIVGVLGGGDDAGHPHEAGPSRGGSGPRYLPRRRGGQPRRVLPVAHRQGTRSPDFGVPGRGRQQPGAAAAQDAAGKGRRHAVADLAAQAGAGGGCTGAS